MSRAPLKDKVFSEGRDNGPVPMSHRPHVTYSHPELCTCGIKRVLVYWYKEYIGQNKRNHATQSYRAYELF